MMSKMIRHLKDHFFISLKNCFSGRHEWSQEGGRDHLELGDRQGSLPDRQLQGLLQGRSSGLPWGGPRWHCQQTHPISSGSSQRSHEKEGVSETIAAEVFQYLENTFNRKLYKKMPF